MLSLIFVLFNGVTTETPRISHPIILKVSPLQCEMPPKWLEDYFKTVHITNCLEYIRPETTKPTVQPVPWK